MKTVILCGGRGTRLGEHGKSVPKALVRIGDEPIIWHLLELYSHFGFDDFVICLGFLAAEIKGYFADSPLASNVSLVETGLDTNTGARIKKVKRFLQSEERFCVTYGDGLADIDLAKLLDFHRDHGRIATLTAVHPVSNFGLLDVGVDGRVENFREKPVLKEWVNGGFFIFERAIFDYLEDDSILEGEPLMRLADEGELMAYRHDGFWKCMDTYKDSLEFNELWKKGAPWKAAE